MQLDLSGKTALVTGSSRGIGRAIAQALCQAGCRVVLNGRSTDPLVRTAAELPNSAFITGDVTKPEETQRVVSKALEILRGRLDILICNVGSGQSVPPGQETYEEWQRVFGLNLWSTTNVVEAAREALIASKGAIVCVSSICGLEVVPNAPVTYSAAKAALHAYVRGIARPLGKQGVRINAVAPGNIQFEGSVWESKLSENTSAIQTMLDQEVALSRFGTPHEVAHLVLYLVSPHASFVTGSVWTLDGGQVHS